MTKGHRFKTQRPAKFRGREGSVAQGYRCLQNFMHSLRAGTGVLEDVGHLADHTNTPAQAHQVEDHLGQIPKGQAAADLAATQATVRANALNLSFTEVTAPIAGRVSDRRVAPGNLVTADNTVLTNIVNLDPIRFAFSGSEALYLKYQRENQAGTRASSRQRANPVEVRLQDEPNYRWKGHMDFVDNTLDTNSGTIRGRAEIPNPDHFLTPGMFGHMRLLGSGSYPALLVPDRAVVTDQERQVVFVVGPDGLARMKPVELGPLTDGLRVVRGGLSPSDRVVIDGTQRVQGGKPVKVVVGRITATPPQKPKNIDIGPPASTATSADRAR